MPHSTAAKHPTLLIISLGRMSGFGRTQCQWLVSSGSHVAVYVCVCLLLQYLLQSCSRGGRGIVEDM
jgi:hypothetical protein